MIEQRIDQSVLGMTCSGMNHQSCGLVDHNQIVVFENDVQWDRLRNGVDFFWGRFYYPNGVAGSDRVAGTRRFAVHNHGTLPNQLLDSRAGKLTELLSQEAVEARPVSLFRD